MDGGPIPLPEVKNEKCLTAILHGSTGKNRNLIGRPRAVARGLFLFPIPAKPRLAIAGADLVPHIVPRPKMATKKGLRIGHKPLILLSRGERI